MTSSTCSKMQKAWLGVLVASLLACGGQGQVAAPTAKTSHVGVLRFYPLDPGWHWSFAVQQTLGEGDLARGRILAVSKVDSFDGRRAVVRTGDETTVLEVSEAGLLRQPSGTYLLRFPLKEGDSWSGPTSTIKVLGTHVDVVSDAGTFHDCVETIETFSGDEAREVRTSYCPEVGPAQMTVHAMGDTGPVVLSARLRSFGPSLDLQPRPSTSPAP